MRINHNIAALNTYNKLSANQSATSKSLEKLSSGLKINKAGDNAAGLAISEKMRGQITGLNTASNNASDGISLINTAEGALSETHSILQRMRELSVQSANDTNTNDDRAEIQKEVSQLTKEVDRISTATEFNTKKLLNGQSGIKITSDNTSITNVLGDADTKAGTYTIGSAALATNATSATAASFATGATFMGADSTLTLNGTSFSFTTSNTVQDVLDAVNAQTGTTGITASYATAGKINFTTSAVGSDAKMDVTATGTDGLAGAETVTAGLDATITSADISAGTYSAKGNNITVLSGNGEGMTFTVAGTAGAVLNANTNNSLKMHIGANEGQTMSISINDMSATALGVATLDVSTQTGAESAINSLDGAIKNVSSERAKLGAYTNRLEHTINNLSTSSENTSSAESRIRDVDMAKEMTEFTKNNILSQAAQSMLAQANQQPQKVLSLLQ